MTIDTNKARELARVFAKHQREIVNFYAPEAAAILAQLADAHDAMAKDAARMDWIENQWADGVHIEICAIGKCSGDVLEKQATVFTRSGDHKSGTVRAAIDAALGANNG